MNILSADERARALAIAAEELGPDGALQMIERYAQGVVDALLELKLSSNTPVTTFAGPGANGADALAVARLLFDAGFRRQEIFLFNIKSRGLADNTRRERDRLLRNTSLSVTEISDSMDFPGLSRDHVVIDGLFGTGLREKMPRGFAVLAQIINESKARVVSLDIPSGLHADLNPALQSRDVVHADITFACGLPMLAYFTPDTAPLTGSVSIIEPATPLKNPDNAASRYHLVEAHDLRRFLRQRNAFTSKADYGSQLIVAGSYGMNGAAVLCSRAALRSGAGRITVHGPRCAMTILQTAVPEVMFHPDRNDLFVTDIAAAEPARLRAFTSASVGPGLGHGDDTVNALDTFIKNYKGAMVLDADALNCIARRRVLLNDLAQGTIITPHNAEFDRLFGESATGEERLLKAVENAARYKIVIVLKGHHTAVIRPDGKVFFNSTGNAGMATPGSGDVLTGIIGALLAQSFRPEVAAVAAVYIHGLAGDIALRTTNTWSLSAGDIVEALPEALSTLLS